MGRATEFHPSVVLFILGQGELELVPAQIQETGRKAGSLESPVSRPRSQVWFWVLGTILLHKILQTKSLQKDLSLKYLDSYRLNEY